ncbi:hypothetical protein GCM10023319_73050 [Nocardia iowensis]
MVSASEFASVSTSRRQRCLRTVASDDRGAEALCGVDIGELAEGDTRALGAAGIFGDSGGSGDSAIIDLACAVSVGS